jgi:hypothetical protein
LLFKLSSHQIAINRGDKAYALFIEDLMENQIKSCQKVEIIAMLRFQKIKRQMKYDIPNAHQSLKELVKFSEKYGLPLVKIDCEIY